MLNKANKAVHGGTLMPQRLPRVELHAVVASLPLQHEVEVAWRHERQAVVQQVAVDGLPDFHGAYLVQAVGKCLGKNRGDMLDDRDSR